MRYRTALEGKKVGAVIALGARPNEEGRGREALRGGPLRALGLDHRFGDYIDDIDNAFWRSAVVLLSIGLALMAVVGVLGWRLAGSIYRRPGGEPAYAADIVHRIGAGDLNVAVDLRGAHADSLPGPRWTDMQRSLSTTVGQIRGSTDTIATAAGEIAAGNRDLSSPHRIARRARWKRRRPRWKS